MVRMPSSLGEGPFSSFGAADSQRSDPDQALWLDFARATTPDTYCQSWLSLQCRLLGGVRCALVLLGPADRGPFTPAAVWPHPTFNVTHLTGAAERALRERRGLLLKNDHTDNPDTSTPQTYHIAYPIEASGTLRGAVIVEVGLRPTHDLQAIMRQLHWGAAWLEVMLLRADAVKAADANERLRKVLEMVTSAVEQGRFQEAAMAFVTKLATSLECDRVNVGFVDGKHVRVSAVSHSAAFGKQMNLIAAIGLAMDEAIDQQAMILYPPSADDVPLVVRAHGELVRQHGSGTICTIPLGRDEKFFGVLMLERPADRSFDQATVEVCETVAALVGPSLDVKRQAERLPVARIAESLKAQLQKLVGPGHLVLKVMTTVVALLVLFFTVAKGDYRVTAPTSLEGEVQRVMGAPFHGYIREAPARAGDIVRRGQVLCLLDDRDLILERLKWATQRDQFLKEYREAMAKHDRAQTSITKAKADQAEAQMDLLDEQLARAKVVAPFDGIVTKGDLSQSLGAPVERGQVLFEVAPLEAYRVIVEVDERDIAEVSVGQRGELRFPSMPGKVFGLTLVRITPVTTAKEGRNYFRLEASLDGTTQWLRPGMEGVAKVTVGRHRLIWIWTHEVIDWVRLQAWRWIP